MCQRLISSFCTFLIFICGSLCASWDVEFWQLVNYTQLECRSVQISGFGELRLNRDISQISYVRVGENIACQVLPNLDLEASYFLIYRKPRGGTHYGFVNRLDLQINPFMYLAQNRLVQWRNRVMFLSIQHAPKILYVLTHRVQLVQSLTECGMLVALKCSDEIYYNIGSGQFTQNRFIPIQLTIAFTPRVSLDLFLMVRNFMSSGNWYRSLVIGSQLEF